MRKQKYLWAYCAFCKNQMKIFSVKHVGVKHILTALLLTCILSYAFWESLHFYSGLFFCTYIVGTEFFLRTRWRAEVICKNCGFDPVLYKKNQSDAVEQVKRNLDERKNRVYGLKPLNLPYRVIKTDNPKAKEIILASQKTVDQKSENNSPAKGQLVEKSI